MKRYDYSDELAEHIMSSPYFWISLKAQINFRRDFEKTKADIEALRPYLTKEMLSGQANDDTERKLIKQYNKLLNHFNKLKQEITRKAYWG